MWLTCFVREGTISSEPCNNYSSTKKKTTKKKKIIYHINNDYKKTSLKFSTSNIFLHPLILSLSQIRYYTKKSL